MLNETCADDKSFPAGFTTVLMTLAHNCPAMFRYFAVRLNVTDACQFPCHGKQRSIKVHRWDDLRREAWTQVRARWRDCANRRCEFDADPKLKVCSWQDFGKYHRPKRNGLSRRFRSPHEADKIPDTLLGIGRDAEFLWIDRRLLKLVLYMRDL